MLPKTRKTLSQVSKWALSNRANLQKLLSAQDPVRALPKGWRLDSDDQESLRHIFKRDARRYNTVIKGREVLEYIAALSPPSSSSTAMNIVPMSLQTPPPPPPDWMT